MSNYTAVPTAELENWQEAREQEMLLKCIKENVARKEQARMEGQARIRELETQRQARVRELQKLAWMAFGWAAGCTVLVILAHTGAIAGWLMQVGTTALSFALGLIAGQATKGCSE